MEKQRWEESERRREELRRSEKRKRARKKMQVHEKVGKSRFTVFFQLFVALGGRKVGLLKRGLRIQLARWEINNCTPLWREAHFQVKSVKNWRVRNTFGSWDVEKVDAIVARSAFPKTDGFGTLLEVLMWGKSVLYAAVARSTFPSQNVQNTPLFTIGSWEVEKVDAIVARSTFPSQKCKKLRGSDHFWTFRCRKSARRCGAKHIWKSKV